MKQLAGVSNKRKAPKENIRTKAIKKARGKKKNVCYRRDIDVA